MKKIYRGKDRYEEGRSGIRFLCRQKEEAASTEAVSSFLVVGATQFLFCLFKVWPAACPNDLLGEGRRVGVFVIFNGSGTVSVSFPVFIP